MSLVLDKYSDGHSILPLSLITQSDQRVSTISIKPLVSNISNLMIKSINGNSSLRNAAVICLSDFHYDDRQKYIRAGIINEILHFRNTTNKEVVILVEGTQAGYVPKDWVYNKLVGDNLIHFDHFVAGWDNMDLNNLSFNLIKEIQNLRAAGKEIEKKYTILNRTKSETLRNVSISPEKIFEKLDIIEGEMTSLLLRSKKISTILEQKYNYVKELTNERNDSLYRSITKILEMRPESIIFVIAGEEHFKNIPQAINNINHSIVIIKEIKTVVNLDEALEEVYGTSHNTNFMEK